MYLIYHTSNRAKRNSLVNLTIKEFHFFPLSTLRKDRPPSLPFIKTRQFHGTEIFKRNVLCAYFHFPRIVKHLSIALISRESGFVGKVNVVTAFWKRESSSSSSSSSSSFSVEISITSGLRMRRMGKGSI